MAEGEDREARFARLRAIAERVPEGAVQEYRKDFSQRYGLQERPGLFGKAMDVLSIPFSAVAAGGSSLARGEGAGAALGEVGQAALLRRTQAPGDLLNKIIPPDPDETPLSGKAIARFVLSLGMDPVVWTRFGAFTSAGRQARAAEPQLFKGPKALPYSEQVAQGFRRTVSAGIPGTGRGLPIVPQKLDAATVAASKAVMSKFAKGFGAAVRSNPITAKAADALMDAFSRKGSSPDVAETREMHREAMEQGLRWSFRHAKEFPAISKGAETIAEQLSRNAGRHIDAGEVMALALDYAENGVRDAARFTDLPDEIKQFGEINLRPFEKLIKREIGTGVRINPLKPSREAVASARYGKIQEAEQALISLDEIGVERLSVDELAKQVRAPSETNPPFFRAAPVTMKKGVAKPEVFTAPTVRGKRVVQRKQAAPPPIDRVEEIARANRTAMEAKRIEEARRVELASELNKRIVQEVDLEVLEARYLPHAVSKYGRDEFFKLKNEQMALAALLPPNHPRLRFSGADKFSKMRKFRRPDGTSIGMIEAQKLAERGELPGYDGIKATKNIFEVDPMKFGLARAFEGEKAIAEMKFARRVVKRFGVPKVDAEGKALPGVAIPEGYESVTEGGRGGAGTELLAGYVFPSRVAKELRHTFALARPSSAVVALFQKAWAETMRLWVEWTILPFFSTISRNGIGEWYFTLLGGGGDPLDAAYALGAMTDVWMPFRNAIERGISNEKSISRLKELGLARLNMTTDGKVSLATEAAEVFPDSNVFMGVQETAQGQRLPKEWRPVDVVEEAFSRNVLGGGWSARDLQETVRMALGQTKKPTFVQKVFETSTLSPVSRRFIGLDPFRKMQSFADDWPRLTHFTALLRKGLTPSEAAFEAKKYHVSPGSLTPFEETHLRPLIPFYRWMKFNLPMSLYTAARHPEIPYLTTKAYEYLTLGVEKLDERDLPDWVKSRFGVPISMKTLEDGRRIATYTSPVGLIPVSDLNEIGSGPGLSDFIFSMWSPFIQQLVEGQPASEKDDLFLGVRMSSTMSNFLRRTWRLGNMLDQMALPKGLSEDEKSYRRKLAISRMVSPVSVSAHIEGEGRRIEAFSIRKQMIEAMKRRQRSLSRFGRLYADPEHVQAVNEDTAETIQELRKQAQELR